MDLTPGAIGCALSHMQMLGSEMVQPVDHDVLVAGPRISWGFC